MKDLGLHKSCAILGLAVFGSGGRIKGEGERLTRRRETEATEESTVFSTAFEKSELSPSFVISTVLFIIYSCTF